MIYSHIVIYLILNIRLTYPALHVVKYVYVIKLKIDKTFMTKMLFYKDSKYNIVTA